MRLRVPVPVPVPVPVSVPVLVLVLILAVTGRAAAGHGHDDDEESPHAKERGPGDNHWSYEEPERWGEHYPACSGNKQSPINIETEKTIFSPELQPIQLSGYSLPNSKKFKLKNNGHTGGCERHRVPLLAGPGFPETLPVALGELCSGAFQPGGEKPGDGELTTRCLWVVAPGICYNPCFL
eukprot:XP_027302652.1 carbonic anhydrase 9-like [Anas platyrhynchos]